MRIDKLTICDNNEVVLNAIFGNKTIIFSEDNSKGKTSLLRFVLYGLGFQIASTQNIQMNSFEIRLTITNDSNKVVTFIRKNKKMDIICCDNDKTVSFSYELPKNQREVLFYAFGEMNKNTFQNILGTFYIDQDVGWSMSNYGPVTKSYNTFDIRDFLSGINTSKERDSLIANIDALTKEIKKYQALFELSKYQKNVMLDKHIMPEDKNSVLIAEKVFIESNISSLRRTKDYYLRLMKHNDEFIEQITRLSPIIRHGNDKFVLTPNDIVGYDVNALIIKTKIYEIDIEIDNESKKLKETNLQLQKQNSLVEVKDIADQVVASVANLNQVSEEQIQRIVEKLKAEKSELERIKRRMTTDNIFVPISNYIIEMTKALGVYDDYVAKTNGPASKKENSIWSGAILNKIVFSYRYAYIKYVYDTCGISLPYIIDSPGASEMTPENAKLIVSAAIRFLPSHQIIVSSIYKNLFEIREFDKHIVINDRLFSKKDY